MLVSGEPLPGLDHREADEKPFVLDEAEQAPVLGSGRPAGDLFFGERHERETLDDPLSPVPLLLPKDCAGQREEENGDLLDRTGRRRERLRVQPSLCFDQQRLMPEGDIALALLPGEVEREAQGRIELIRRKVRKSLRQP